MHIATWGFGSVVVSVVLAMAGPIVLAIPYSFLAGYYITILWVLFGVLFTWTAILLAKCQFAKGSLSTRNIKDYTESIEPRDIFDGDTYEHNHSSLYRTYAAIAEAAYGSCASHFMSVILSLELFGICVSYMILMGTNFVALQPFYLPWDTSISFKLDQDIWMTLCGFVLLPLVFINPSTLSKLSQLGIIMTISFFIITLTAGIFDPPKESIEHIKLDILQVPLSIGIIAVSYTAHAVFPQLVLHVENLKTYPLALYVSFTFTILFYVAFGIVGYYFYGENVASQIQFNLPRTYKMIMSICAIVLPLCKFSLMIEPVCHTFENVFASFMQDSTIGSVNSDSPYALLNSDKEEDEDAHRYISIPVRIISRTLVVVICVVLSILVPFFNIFSSLVGSLLSITVCVTFPLLCYQKMLPDGPISTPYYIFLWFMIITSGCCSIICTYFSLIELYQQTQVNN